MFSKQLHFLLVLHVVFAIALATISNNSFGSRAFVRYPSCREHLPEDDSHLKSIYKSIVPRTHLDKPKGYLGRVGILGGAHGGSGAAYFAAIAALRVGADEVHIYCNRASALAINIKNPDINVHPLLDVDVNKLVDLLSKNDVILIGPGLNHEQHSINTINTLVNFCKTLKKPIIFDLHPYFLTQTLVDLILSHPTPGIILAMNSKEFETLYPFIKAKDAFSDAHINVDFTILGNNTLIYRKGCTDSAISANAEFVWALSEGGSIRRCPGQGNVISGAMATYFHWALTNINSIEKQKLGAKYYNYAASVASYSAAVMMRACNKRAYGELGKSALTSDMVSEIGSYLYGAH